MAVNSAASGVKPTSSIAIEKSVPNSLDIFRATYDVKSGILTVYGKDLVSPGSITVVNVAKLSIGPSDRRGISLTNFDSPTVNVTDPTSFSVSLTPDQKSLLARLAVFDSDGSSSNQGVPYILTVSNGWIDGAAVPGSISLDVQNTDIVPPMLVSSSHSDSAGSSAVGISEHIDLVFSEEVQAASGKIILRKSDGTEVASIKASDASQVVVRGSTVIINPALDLDLSSAYTVEVDPRAFTDLAGNSYPGLSGASRLSFTTGDAAPLSAPSPAGPSPSIVAPPSGSTVDTSGTHGSTHKEVIAAVDGTIVDGNKDGIPDNLQGHVAAVQTAGSGVTNAHYGAIEVNSALQITSLVHQKPGIDGTIAVQGRNSETLATSIPRGATNATNGPVAFEISGLAPGDSTTVFVHFPEALTLEAGDAYVKFNYTTNQYEEYVDGNGNRLYELIDSNDDGIYDAAKVNLIDGDQTWDRDGQANGVVSDNGFLVYGQRDLKGSKKNDVIIGNLLKNTIKGKAGNDFLEGGLSIDKIIGGRGRDRYIYNDVTESEYSERDSVKFRDGDRFVFKTFDADLTTDGRQKLNFIGKKRFTGLAGELRATSSVLEADLTGDGLADFAINLIGRTVLSADSFSL